MGVALDDLIKVGQEIVPGGSSGNQTPATAGAEALRPIELAMYLAAQVYLPPAYWELMAECSSQQSSMTMLFATSMHVAVEVACMSSPE